MHPLGYKVLVDVSYASLGYCGIAQESRILLKALYRLQGVEPTGLLFGHDDAVIAHKFASTARLAHRMENQALFVQALIDKRAPCSPVRAIRLLQTWKRNWRLALAKRIRTDRLDNEVFWDAIWRGLLARSLSDDDIDIAQRCPMLLANLGGRMLATRALFGLPSVRLDTRAFDFALFHNAQAIRVSPNTCKLVRYYDMIPGMRPDMVDSQADVAYHFRAIRRCLKDSIFVCDSGPARDDLVRAFPELEERSAVIPAGLSDGYYPEHLPNLLNTIVRNRRAPLEEKRNGTRQPGRIALSRYLLMTSTIEPRKNHVMLIRAFETLLARRRTNLKLVIVGQPGWKFGEALQAMKPLIEQQRVIHLVNLSLRELRVLNTHAEAVVFPSLYEGFGYAPLEAMCCHTPVVVSDIAAHRWTYGDAAVYFDPYRVDSIVEALERVVFSESGLPRQLVEAGIARVQRYSAGAIGDQWLGLFDKLSHPQVQARAEDARLARYA